MAKRASSLDNDYSPRKRRRSQSFDTDASEDADSDHERDDIIKIFIVPAKLDAPAFEELVDLVDHAPLDEHSSFRGFKMVSDAIKSDVIVTAVHMRQRLERHVPWNLAVSLSQPKNAHVLPRPNFRDRNRKQLLRLIGYETLYGNGSPLAAESTLP